MGIRAGLSFLFNVSLQFNLCCISKILRISSYGTASTDSAAYILGGAFTSTKRTSIIAQFQNNEWIKIGDLKEAKNDLSAISHDGEYLIIGGESSHTNGR